MNIISHEIKIVKERAL